MSIADEARKRGRLVSVDTRNAETMIPAVTAGATVIILHEDTPGGLLTAGLEISQFIKQQTDIHTIAYIHKAYSAGALIAMACDEIAMEPNAAIGDCAPIMLSPDGSLTPLPDTERAKAASPVLAALFVCREQAACLKTYSDISLRTSTRYIETRKR